jgi:two-component system sensor histidine kinase CreC
MPLGVRIFLVYCVFVGLTSYFIFSTVMDEIRPGVRQSTEETLVDTANLLAEMLQTDLKAGTLSQAQWSDVLSAYGQRAPQATIWGLTKTGVNHRIYVTDAKGIVLLDSTGAAVGQDYSQWNDVMRTLRGEYGARSTQEVLGDENSTVMYVAAPIRDGENIIGVVTVAKPNKTLQPYIERSQRRLALIGGGLIVLGLGIGAALSWWLSNAIGKLTAYSRAVSEGQRAALPEYSSAEFAQLATAIERMRTQLEGKAYVERYVQTLTHELKSPIAAIRGGAEILRGEVADEQRRKFVANIDNESRRLEQLVERLLNLAVLEQRMRLETPEAIALRPLCDELLSSYSPRTTELNLRTENSIAEEIVVRGERLLIQQALRNLLDNAFDFVVREGTLRLSVVVDSGEVRISLFNSGDPIPEYALPRVTERFYSLPRPANGRKSTGLGLNFAQEVAELHNGTLVIRNVEGGVEATLTLPSS